MSVYSGFTTRQQEVTYGRLTESLLLLLQETLLHSGPLPKDRHWTRKFLQTYARMNKQEGRKYLPPRLSSCVKELAVSEGLESNYASERKPRQAFFYSPQPERSLALPQHRYGHSVRKKPKYTIEWTDMKPKSRKYYGAMLIRKLERPRVLSNRQMWRPL